jgi:hypothetical protein
LAEHPYQALTRLSTRETRMRNSYRYRFGLIAVAALILAALSPTVASAAPEDTFITFSGEGGDWVTADQTWFYNRTNSTIIVTGSEDNNHIRVRITGDTFWNLDLAAPAGQALEPGSYPVATRYPFQLPADAGLSLFGDGRGCNTSTGSFEVLEATFGPSGWIERFHATFEQHCEGDPNSRAFGEVLIDNGPAPAVLVVDVTVDPRNRVSSIGRVSVGGTVTCSKPAVINNMFGTLTQRVDRRSVSVGNWFLGGIACSEEPTAWSAEVQASFPLPPFNPGKAQVDISTMAFDEDYGIFRSGNFSTIVSLTRR